MAMEMVQMTMKIGVAEMLQMTMMVWVAEYMGLGPQTMVVFCWVVMFSIKSEISCLMRCCAEYTSVARVEGTQ